MQRALHITGQSIYIPSISPEQGGHRARLHRSPMGPDQDEHRRPIHQARQQTDTRSTHQPARRILSSTDTGQAMIPDREVSHTSLAVMQSHTALTEQGSQVEEKKNNFEATGLYRLDRREIFRKNNYPAKTPETETETGSVLDFGGSVNKVEKVR